MEAEVSFGAWLRRRRKTLDLTQEAVAAQVGCSAGLIRKIEADERRPSRQVAELLAAVLAIPATERDTFLKVARAQIRTEQLATISAVPPALPQPPPAEAIPVSMPASVNLSLPQSAPVTPLPGAALPIPPTPLVGRERELQALTALLTNPDCRLLTIVGPGGMGKTRLALALAAAPPPAFGHGVVFVALAPLAEPQFIVSAIANALTFTFASGADPKQQLLSYLRDKQLLLVLDNLEHLLAGVDLLSELLAYCAALKLLVTSRERLYLQGEWVFDLQGLPVPASGETEPLAAYSAVALFVASARRVQPGFSLDEENGAAIARICRLVDGMPLGLELAAAWVHLLSCAEIAQEMEQSVDFLAVARRDAPDRHRSLRTVFDHSWRLLSAEEQQGLAALAIFRGGFTRAAAAAVAGASLPLLAALVAKSLVQRRESGRYDLHELVRQYAGQRLEEFGQATTVRNQALAFFTHLAQATNQQIGRDQHQAAMAQIEGEMGNLRAALRWALQSRQADLGLQLALALVTFWDLSSYWLEGNEWLLTLLAAGGDAVPLRLRAQVLQGAGDLSYSHSDVSQARTYFIESLQIWQGLNDRKGMAELLHRCAFIAKDEAEELANFEQSLALCRELNDQRAVAYVLLSLGRFASGHIKLAQALDYYTESLALFRTIGDRIGIAHVLRGMGVVAYRRGDYREAQMLQEEGLALFRELRFKRGIAVALNDLGDVALGLQEYARARQCYLEDLQLGVEMDSKWDIAWSFEGLAQVAQAQQQTALATQLLSASQFLFTAINFRWRPEDRKARDARIALLRTQLGEQAFATAWERGCTMPLSDVIRLAQQQLPH